MIVRKLKDSDSRVIRWFGHMVRMGDGRMVNRAMKAEVSVRLSNGRPKSWWMVRVKPEGETSVWW